MKIKSKNSKSLIKISSHWHTKSSLTHPCNFDRSHFKKELQFFLEGHVFQSKTVHPCFQGCLKLKSAIPGGFGINSSLAQNSGKDSFKRRQTQQAAAQLRLLDLGDISQQKGSTTGGAARPAAGGCAQAAPAQPCPALGPASSPRGGRTVLRTKSSSTQAAEASPLSPSSPFSSFLSFSFPAPSLPPQEAGHSLAIQGLT